MNHILALRIQLCALSLLFLFRSGASTAQAETTIYSTGFEPDEGYSTEFDLAGQDGWVGDGGSGILTNFFAGFGQQAYIGFAAPPGNTSDFLSVYRPINLAPVPPTQALIKFSVMLQIVDSTSTNWDEFRWSVYNADGKRLFSLDFDNAPLTIYYLLDDTAGFISTDTKFDNEGYYDLEIAMNFARNFWTATLNDLVIVNAKPITTVGSALTLGDIDAVWVLRDPAHSGENYMLFDDYRITADALSSIPPRLELIGLLTTGSFKARLHGEPGISYRIEISSDLIHWSTLSVLTAPPQGTFDFEDPGAARAGHRFYRARQEP